MSQKANHLDGVITRLVEANSILNDNKLCKLLGISVQVVSTSKGGR